MQDLPWLSSSLLKSKQLKVSFTHIQRIFTLTFSFLIGFLHACGVILQNVINVSRLFNNPDIPESVEFLSRFSVASYGFSRLVTNDLGYLVSKVDGDYFNPKEISNIQDLHSDNGDSHYLVIGTIKEIGGTTRVCGHAVVEHEDLYLCDACGSYVKHIMVKLINNLMDFLLLLCYAPLYVLLSRFLGFSYDSWLYGIRAARCTVLFVLLDNAATKLFGRTCSEAFLRIEEEFPIDPSVLAVCRSYSPQMFDHAVGEEKVFKVEIDSAVDPEYSSCFKIVNVFSHNPELVAADDYINYATGEDYKTQVVCDNAIQLEIIEDIITDLISPNRCYSDADNGGFVFILEIISSVLKNHKWWFSTCLCGSLVFCLKVVVSHSNGNNIFILKDREVVQIIKTRCSSFSDNHPELSQGSYCKVVPLKLILSLLHKKVVFMVDAKPVGYEMNRSVYIIQQIWDDASVINIHVLVDSMLEVEDAFSQCESDHEDVVNERKDSSAKHAREYTVYTGTVGTMSVAIDALGKISPWKEAWSIEAKILTIWEDATIVNENMQKLLHMVLMDKQHHKIQATVEDNLITSFIDQLKEGEVFIISDFKVIPNRGLVRVQDIDFASFSSVVPLLLLLQVHSYPTLCVDYEYLIDFVGVLCGLKKRRDVECNGKILKVLTLEVFADGKKISCNFVGDCPALIDMNSLKRYQRPPAVILQSFKIKVNRDKVSLQNVINISRVLINPDMQKIKLIRTIDNLKANNEDGQFLWLEKLRRLLKIWSGVFFLCLRSSYYRIKILVEDCTSSGMFVLLDSPATKLLGRTCSDMFLLLEDEIDDVSFDSAFSPIFEDFSRYGQLRSYENQLIFGVPIQPHSIKEMLADILCAKIYSSASRNDQICFLIGEIIDVLKHQKVECVDAIGRYRIKIIVSHSNGRNIFILEDDESTNDYTVSNGIISQLMNKKIVLIVDPRPVGYELNTSLHVVRAVCDDVEIVKFLKDSSHDNQQQPLTIREELWSAFGQCENTVETVEMMDECSG
ncbi:hypothetical protein Ahy_A04g020462 [Arachis hypogaea]|uniref:Replication protein A 70 kDa DNA-binding subunit B/D first OB fold domain-containing protein n=1 Tax=Arachis hypogaea TaxID=3818 RepID=A0A445DHS9_ARAHY|nr:hypothetical protein Ahy_A04g020462 [Arachis hypogaea]